MNNYQTIEKLKQMRLNAMASLHQQNVKENRLNNYTADEYLAMLSEYEWEERQNKKTHRLLKQANFRQQATIAQIDYTTHRNLDKNMFMRLSTLDFMKKNENIIITGASGVGKSYLAHAFGHQACMTSLKVLYCNTSRLFNKLKLAKIDGTFIRELNKINNVELLILDDFGLQAFDNFSRESLLDIIDERFNRASTIVASQMPVSAWYEIIGENTIADAILDRLVNSSHRIDLVGESMRKRILKNEI